SPQIKPGQTANDKVLVLEDRDGDGKADTTNVFADGLLIPTGVEPGDGGAYVANSTELVHFQDTDGDGKADLKRVLLSGFGTEDTHHILHTFRWGMDGMLYFNQSIYIHSHIETPWGVRRLGGGGIWQFRPETLQLEILCRGFVNTWGHHFDDWGQSFATDGAYGEGVNYVFPGSVWVTAPGATRIMKGLNPGSPKHCGLEIVGGSHLPDDWQGNMITNDFRGHRVCRFVITEDGSGFASREQQEVIKTEHVAFRPIDVKMGPDGAIYIADWYNPIIQHGEVDFRDPRRDHTHGRIWRVTAKGRPLVKRPQLANAPVPALLDALKSSEYFTRHHAKRVLKERGAKAVLGDLERWIAKLDPADPQYEHHKLEALWTSQSLDVVSPRLLGELLQARDHRARAAAVRVLSQWQSRIPDALMYLTAAVRDEHPRVRLEAVRALALIPGLKSAELALEAYDLPLDANLDFALWQTARDLKSDWLPAVQKEETDFGGNVGRQIFALKAIGTPAIVPPLVRLLKSGRVPSASEEGVMTTIAAQGGPAELRLVYDLALADARNPERRASAVKLFSALNTAAESRKVVPDGDLSTLAGVFGLGGDLDSVASRAAGHWKLESLRPRLKELAFAATQVTPAFQGAIDGLAVLGGDASRETLTALVDHQRPQAIRVRALNALASIDLAAAARLTVDMLVDTKPNEDPTPLYETIWRQKQGPAEFVTALGDRRLPEDVAKLGIRTARVSGRDLPDAIAALTKAGGLTGSEKMLTPEQMRQLIAAVKEQGSAERGEKIFRRADQVCLKCHAVSGSGGQVGPDLASIGASAQIDYLIDSLLLPNKAVKENYHSVVVETKAGKVITGVKVRQSDSELVLRDAEDQEVS
ncbi:MAG TPA: PVC-type heme-binding CxxCH protein, partial [Planctomycetaceae bacterium]|nr:PVC-type heme-binding CxxCH protein [Planctomycetaceae bacterium]